ncbi:MAG: hypothetical protein FJ291_13695 [Planctomycetes bacterium]|nr:hypothetical protein [Planctomycetota bacterium]
MRENDSTLDAVRLLTVNEVSDLLRLSPRSIWREAARAEAGLTSFPKPFTIGGGRLRRWRLADVRSYIDGLIGGAAR